MARLGSRILMNLLRILMKPRILLGMIERFGIFFLWTKKSEKHDIKSLYKFSWFINNFNLTNSQMLLTNKWCWHWPRLFTIPPLAMTLLKILQNYKNQENETKRCRYQNKHLRPLISMGIREFINACFNEECVMRDGKVMISDQCSVLDRSQKQSKAWKISRYFGVM